jgi:hypothetical protein
MILDRPLGSVRRRLRLQAAFDGAARAAVLAAALMLGAVYLWRLRVFGGRGLGLAGVLAVAIVVAGALERALRRIPLDRAALAIDVSHALHDRLRSALAFSAETAPTPFMLAAIADAAEVAQTVDPRRAAPWHRPEPLAAAAVVATVAVIVGLLQFPSHAHIAALPPLPPRLSVDRALLEPERQAAAELAAIAAQSGDEDTKRLAEQLNQLLQQIDAEELTRKQAFDKLAQLENKYLQASDGQLDELKQKLRKAGTELAKSKKLAETGRALQEDDPAKAQKELQKLAAEAEARSKDPRPDSKFEQQQREEMARALEEAARQQEKTAEEKKQQQEEQRLRDEERRLEKELAEKPDDPELQRKLQRNQRELQRLEREKQAKAEQQRQLQRLQRELERAAEQLRQKLSPEALQQLSEQMRQMQNEMTKLGNQGRAQMQIAEIKEVLRRAGKSSPGQNGPGGKDGKSGQGQSQQAANGKGQKGKGKGKGDKSEERLREFDQRAGGKSDTLILGENGGKSDTQLLLPMPMGPGQQKPGPSGKEPGQELPGGDGIGKEHDANLMGDATALGGKRHDTRVEGAQGAGPSRSQTILGSAEKGFASTGYKRVYGDYTAVVEEVMSKERVPPGYRFFIKRYFQLIKPRE